MTKLEQVARAIYELAPFEESGEYVESFLVSPGGKLSWEQASAREAEFTGDKIMLPITKFAWDAARAAVEELRAHNDFDERDTWQAVLDEILNEKPE